MCAGDSRGEVLKQGSLSIVSKPLNPQLNASLVGLTTTINTPSAGAAFVQAGMYGTMKFADNAFAYAGVTAEARSGQILAGGNIGVRVQF